MKAEGSVEGVVRLTKAGLEVEEDKGGVDGDGEGHEGACRRILELIFWVAFQVTSRCC